VEAVGIEEKLEFGCQVADQVGDRLVLDPSRFEFRHDQLVLVQWLLNLELGPFILRTIDIVALYVVIVLFTLTSNVRHFSVCLCLDCTSQREEPVGYQQCKCLVQDASHKNLGQLCAE
jgi:hypothetical protein